MSGTDLCVNKPQSVPVISESPCTSERGGGHYATSRKVVGSIPDEVIGFFFNLPNPSSRTMALGSTQPLTQMSTRNFRWG
jgi:hypothetical protein